MPDVIVTQYAEDALAECDLYMVTCGPGNNFYTHCIDEIVDTTHPGRLQLLNHSVSKCRYGNSIGVCFQDDIDEFGTPYDAAIVSKCLGPHDVTPGLLKSVANLFHPAPKSISTPFSYFLGQYLREIPDWFTGGLYLEISPTERNQDMVSNIFRDSPMLNIYLSQCPCGSTETFKEMYPSWKTPRNLTSLTHSIRTINSMWD